MSDWQQASYLTTCDSLLLAAEAANPLAWQHVSRIYSPLVYSWLRARCIPCDDCADITQDVFLSVFRNLARFLVAPGHFRSWLWVITEHKACDYLRKLQKRPRERPLHDFDVSNLVEAWDPPSEATQQEMPLGVCQRALELARAHVSPTTWNMAYEVLVLEQRPAQVAERNQVSPSAVYKAKSRLLSELRRLLAGFEP